MNIKYILKENGLEIVSHINMKYFRLKLTEKEMARRLNFKELYDYNLEGEFNVEIIEMGFNESGGLYIVFTCMDDEHFEKGDTFEVIEYEGGKDNVKSNL